MSPLTLSLPRVTLIDFTLSNARRFYSSMGNPTGVKGLSKLIRNKVFYSGEFNLWRKIVVLVSVAAWAGKTSFIIAAK